MEIIWITGVFRTTNLTFRSCMLPCCSYRCYLRFSCVFYRGLTVRLFCSQHGYARLFTRPGTKPFHTARYACPFTRPGTHALSHGPVRMPFHTAGTYAASYCVFERHIISINHVVFSTDTSHVIVLCSSIHWPLTRPKPFINTARYEAL